MRARYEALFEKFECRAGYWREAALTEFVVDLTRRMRARKITKAVLAERLHISPLHVAKILQGDDLTLDTLVRLAMAVDGVVHLHIADPGIATRWRDEPWGKKKAAT